MVPLLVSKVTVFMVRRCGVRRCVRRSTCAGCVDGLFPGGVTAAAASCWCGRRARRGCGCGGRRLPRGEDDLDLRAGEVRQVLLQRRRVVPLGHVGDARGAAADGDLAAPAPHLLADLLEPLAAAGSRKRVTPWMNAASSAVASPQRSPKRAECSRSSDPLNPIPRSITAITATFRPSRRCQLYVWIPTHPGASACSMMFCDTSERSMLKPMASALE
jgi:hypothetical protein